MCVSFAKSKIWEVLSAAVFDLCFLFDKSRLWSCVSAVGANFCSSDIKAFMLGKGTTYSVLLDKGTK